MFCRKCGEELADGAVFCKKCGSKVVGTDNHKKVIVKTSKVQSNQSAMIFLRGGVIIFSLFMILATVSPLYRIDSKIAKLAGIPQTMSFFKMGNTYADGIILIIFAGIIILFTCFNKRIPVLLCSLLSILLYVYDFMRLQAVFRELERQLSSGIIGYFADIDDFIRVEAGYYLLPISIGLLLLTSIFYTVKRN